MMMDANDDDRMPQFNAGCEIISMRLRRDVVVRWLMDTWYDSVQIQTS